MDQHLIKIYYLQVEQPTAMRNQ